MINIKVVGDIMPGGILNKKHIKFLSNNVADFLKTADIRIGTLECGIGNEPSFCPIKRSKGSSAFVYAEDKDLERLRIMNINAVSLANNHFFDLGEIGTKHTINLLKKYGIQYFGAGINLEEAQKPAVFNISGKTIAFYGFCDTKLKHCQFATVNTPGINPLQKENVINLIKSAKNKYDYVFVIVHWGKEHTWWPRPHVVKFAKLFQEVGVSGIIGDHPHRVQSVCKINGCPVAYSLGNFLFPNRVINSPYVTYYPSDITAIEKMKTVYGFTKVQEPTLKLWPEIANIGMVLDIHCNNHSRVMMDYKLTQITHSGFIDFLNKPQSIKSKLRINKYIIENPLYPYIIISCDLFYKFSSKCISKFKRIIKRFL